MEKTSMKIKELEKRKELTDKIFNMILDKVYLTVQQILFNPMPSQEREYWCGKCDGFHKTIKCNCEKYGSDIFCPMHCNAK